MRTVFIARTDPASEPVTLAEAKLACRIDGADEDTYISDLIVSARTMAEAHIGRTLLEATWDAVLDAFADEIELRNPPIVQVLSVKYLDEAGVEQTLDTSIYAVDSVSEPGRVLLASGKRWPTTFDGPNAVRVRFKAGYGAAADVPQPIKHWMLLHIGHYFRNRELAGAAMQPLPYADSLLQAFETQYF